MVTRGATLARGRILTLVLLVLVSLCLTGDRELMNVLSVQIMADLHISKTRFYLLNDRRWVLAMLFVPIAASISLVGPIAALTQSLVAIRMRARASAVVLLTGSIAGGSLGPFIVGVVADHLEPMVGRDSVRYALLGLSVFNLWAAAHFWLAGRTLRQDLQRAAEAS